MTPVLLDDQLIISATCVECAALWTRDESVFLNAWDPCRLELYCSRWCRLPGEVPLCTPLDFTDRAGRHGIQLVDWSSPSHPPCPHPGVLAPWEVALARHLLRWETSLTHPRFAGLRTNNPLLLRQPRCPWIPVLSPTRPLAMCPRPIRSPPWAGACC